MFFYHKEFQASPQLIRLHSVQKHLRAPHYNGQYSFADNIQTLQLILIDPTSFTDVFDPWQSGMWL